MSTHPSEQVDRVAQAICATEGYERWAVLSEHGRGHYRRMACAALDAATPRTQTITCEHCGSSPIVAHLETCPKTRVKPRRYTDEDHQVWADGSVRERDR